VSERTFARFGHDTRPATDFCAEVKELERIAESARPGYEIDAVALDNRIERAMDFRVGADADCVVAKARLIALAEARGFVVDGEIAYFGQPMARRASAALSALPLLEDRHE
jgi:hypothetical protein